MTLKHKAFWGLVWSAIQRGGNQALSFLVFLVLSRLLGPEEFGLVALAAIFTNFVQVFVDQGYSIAIVQFSDLEREHLDTAFWTSIFFGVCLAGIGIGVSPLFAAFFREPELAPILVWLSLDMILVSLSSTQQAVLMRAMDYKGLAKRTLIGTLAGGLAGILAAFAGMGVYSLVIKTIVMHLVSVAVLWKLSDWRPGFHFSMYHFKALFGFGRSITANNLLVFMSRRADNFLIGSFIGTTALGFYSIAYNFIQTLIDLFVSTSTSVTISTFSRLQNDREQMRQGFYMATQYSSLIAFPVFVTVSILAPSLVVLLFGEKWLPSVPVMQVLALMGLIYPVSIFNTQVLVAVGKPSWRLRIMLVYAIADVLGFLVAVRWGIVAVAAALVLRMFLLSPISYLAVHRVLKIDIGIYLRQLIPSLVGIAALSATIVGLSPFLNLLAHPYLKLLILSLSGGAMYLLVIQWLAPQISRELFDLIRPSLSWPRRP